MADRREQEWLRNERARRQDDMVMLERQVVCVHVCVYVCVCVVSLVHPLTSRLLTFVLSRLFIIYITLPINSLPVHWKRLMSNSWT